MTIHAYGYIEDSHDPNDKHLQISDEQVATIPAKTDLSNLAGAAYDQGDLGSCVGNSVAKAFEIQMRKQNEAFMQPARLFIYGNARLMEGTFATDSGAMIRDGMKSLSKYGVCSETDLPYDINKFNVPFSQQCYTDALLHQAISYWRVTKTLDQLRACLAAGYPFVYGFKVFPSFESQVVATTGIVPMPTRSELKQKLGGHAVCCVGYDDTTERFLTINSWGTSWGANSGYFYLPYEYMDCSYVSDIWTLRTVE